MTTHLFRTFTGRFFCPLDPNPADICITDIAHSLSLLCRFNGHCPWFYSVAEHSLCVSQFCAPADALSGLLHDASEAYLSDLIRPVKRSDLLFPYRRAEQKLQLMIAAKFGLPPALPPSVRRADKLMLGIESYQFFGAVCHDADVDPKICKEFVILLSMSPTQAERQFLARFHELTNDQKSH